MDILQSRRFGRSISSRKYGQQSPDTSQSVRSVSKRNLMYRRIDEPAVVHLLGTLSDSCDLSIFLGRGVWLGGEVCTHRGGFVLVLVVVYSPFLEVVIRSVYGVVSEVVPFPWNVTVHFIWQSHRVHGGDVYDMSTIGNPVNQDHPMTPSDSPYGPIIHVCVQPFQPKT